MLCLLARQSDSELTDARAASSTDGNNYNFSSSGRPGVTRTPFTALGDLSVQPQLASGSQSAVTASPAGHFKTACVQLEARTRAKTSESAGPGPGNPSDPEGPCRRRHGCCWPCAGRQAPASRWRAPQFCIQQTDTVYRV